MKLVSLLAYITSSTLIVLLNKYLLTFAKFPSALLVASSQMVFTTVSLAVASYFALIEPLPTHAEGFRRSFPLPLLYCASAFFGLSATGSLSLPMFSVLRRTSLFIGLVGEYFILGVVPRRLAVLCICMNVVGALVAAAEDLAFDLVAYVVVMCANFSSIGAAIFSKVMQDPSKHQHAVETTLGEEEQQVAKPLTKWMLLYFNSIFSLPFMIAAVALPSVQVAYAEAFHMLVNGSWFLIINFIGCSVMGVVLNYSILIAIRDWGPLTVSVVGVMKGNLLALVSMIIATDYVYSFVNAVGILISAIASVVYILIKFQTMRNASAERKTEDHERPAFLGGPSAMLGMRKVNSFDYVVNAQIKAN